LDEQIVLEVSQQSKLGNKGKEALVGANDTVLVWNIFHELREPHRHNTLFFFFH
jgi:hypothetical protein